MPSQGRKRKSSMTKAPHQIIGSHPTSGQSASATSNALAFHANSNDFFDESLCTASSGSASDKARREASSSASHAGEPTRGAGMMDNNAHLNRRDFDMNTGRDLGLITESEGNVKDGILRIRGTFYAKVYVTVSC